MNWLVKTFEISHTDHKPIRSMEGIRGFAVFLVFLVHYVTFIEPWLLKSSSTSQAATYIRSMGNVGVDLFFVLSGFLIYGMLIKRDRPFKSYFLRRIQRIYPTFTVVLIGYLLLSVVFPTKSKIPADWSEALVLILQNFLLMPGLFEVPAIITVAWSLSYEFFYYLFTPLLVALASMRSRTARKRVLFFVSVSIFCFAWFALYGGHIRLMMFVSGILLFEAVESGRFRQLLPLGLPSLLLALASVVVAKEADAMGWWIYVLLYVLFFMFCLECFTSSGFTTRLFSAAPLRWLGNMSYSYYLIHGLALNASFIALAKVYPASQDGTLLFWLFLPAMFFLTLVPSAVLFIWVEKPYSLVRKRPAKQEERDLA